MAATLLLTLRGTPTLYYGDELGMRDVPIPPDRVQDPWERRVPGGSAATRPHAVRWTDRRRLLRRREPWLPLDPAVPQLSSASARTLTPCSPTTASCWPCAARRRR